jgi:hypothetical protein
MLTKLAYRPETCQRGTQACLKSVLTCSKIIIVNGLWSVARNLLVGRIVVHARDRRGHGTPEGSFAHDYFSHIGRLRNIVSQMCAIVTDRVTIVRNNVACE